MATAKKSKNNPTNRKEQTKAKLVYSSDCESCDNRCKCGEEYLKLFKIKHEGKGVVCRKEK
jgi:hypothetical protein